MLQIAICDDEPVSLQNIEAETKQCLNKQNIFPLISTFTNGEQLLYALCDCVFDLPLLDIEMPEEFPNNGAVAADDISVILFHLLDNSLENTKNPCYTISSLSASIIFSFLILLVAYIIVINTIKSTPITLAAILPHGSTKSISSAPPFVIPKYINQEISTDKGIPTASARIP